MECVKLSPTAILPTRGSEFAAGLDLYSDEDKVISGTVIVSTSIAVKIPTGYYGQIHARSSLGAKGVIVCGGVIDSDYRGEIKVILHLSGLHEIKINKGDRIAQMIILPINNILPVEVESLDQTNRGEGGFGSTGV